MHRSLRHITPLFFAALFASCGGGTEPGTDLTTVASVTVGSSATTIAPGTTVQMTATARNSAGTVITAPSAATWSSSNQGTATVSSSGLVTAVANGTTTITATIAGIPGTRGITVATITPVPAATVEASAANVFSPQQVNLTIGGTVTWTFGPVEHNVTFSTSGTGTPTNIGNTANASVSKTFSTAGSFPYACTLHVGMSGTVIVQ
jgi:plastocyanin